MRFVALRGESALVLSLVARSLKIHHGARRTDQVAEERGRELATGQRRDATDGSRTRDGHRCRSTSRRGQVIAS